MRALRTETATTRSNTTRLGLVLALRVLVRLDDHALLGPDGLAADKQLEAAGVFRVPVEALALDALWTRRRRSRPSRTTSAPWKMTPQVV
jgi:hypothetical protein